MVKTIVSCGVICRMNEFLICKKGNEKDMGLWEFPGGKLKQSENIFNCISREIKEELSIKVKPLKEIHRYEFSDYILVFIQCIITQPEELLVLNEHTDYKWIQLQDVINYSFVPGDVKFVEFLMKNENNLNLSVD
jgi:mutator protein MutT